MLRTVFSNHQRYQEQYMKKFPGYYFTGDAAQKDLDGYFWILGRVDDVVNVSGHRLSTMEIESSLVAHEDILEAAVVDRPTQLKVHLYVVTSC